MEDIEQLLSELDKQYNEMNNNGPIEDVPLPPWTFLDDYDEAHALYMKNLRPCLRMMHRYELVLDPEHYTDEFQKAFVKHYINYAKRVQNYDIHTEWLKNPKVVDVHLSEVYENTHYLQYIIY
jgi:hypothetical protein